MWVTEVELHTWAKSAHKKERTSENILSDKGCMAPAYDFGFKRISNQVLCSINRRITTRVQTGAISQDLKFDTSIIFL